MKESLNPVPAIVSELVLRQSPAAFIIDKIGPINYGYPMQNTKIKTNRQKNLLFLFFW